jgi:tetraacyldisaccharide 4'-kinase
MYFNIIKAWYRPSYTWLTFLLLPFSYLFRFIVAIRYFFYRAGFKKTHHLPVRVIVVGNITTGGTGKTPFVIWLAQFLWEHGWQPGIVTRGYGGIKNKVPQFVEKNASPSQVGDEAILLRQRVNCPVAVCVDRVAAAQALIAQHQCNIIISDDGLQHYSLARDLEIAIIDGDRRLGNNAMLPAGPLREPASRLKRVDFIVAQQQAKLNEYLMRLEGNYLVSLLDHSKMAIADLKDKKVHAVAAIGNPQRFFANLSNHGLQLIEHIFPDHYLYQPADFSFQDQLPIVMTEKDAVKCKIFADARFWYLPVETKLDVRFEHALLNKLKGESYV